jgi:VanZ family protein
MASGRQPSVASKPTEPIGKRRTWLRWVIWGLFALVWTQALLVPDPDGIVRGWFLTADSSAEARAHLDLGLFYFSKALHVAAYGIFAVLSAWTTRSAPGQAALLALISAHAFGSELIQNFVPDRTPSFRDVGLDHVGIVLGVAATWPRWFMATAFKKRAASVDVDCPSTPV